ncbi:putative acid anhydride hydrolase [Saccharomycopsis crataegensis]|uniref:Cation-transporting ATPase n=1 Tax=Saccharomycopsis crataegensis TaxID=43959 RepID=A0AAV5QRF2_9ASCO|nr:putative acid anhydride hydrolase [Saccharomycopsis crataegensis]
MPRSHDKSLKLTRTRSNSVTRRNSTSSIGSKNLYLDENDTEIFSGVGSEIIPSSIATFHHSHNFEDNEEDTEENQDDQTENLLESQRVSKSHDAISDSRNEGGSQLNRNSLVNDRMGSSVSVRSRNNSIESGNRPNFKFFTSDEIENAQGVSSTLDDPLVDYDTDWNIGPSYNNLDEENTTQLSEELVADDQNSGSQNTAALEISEHESFSAEANYRTRLLSDVSHTTFSSISHENDELTPRSVSDKVFFPDSKVHFQRFYIAEEDLVIGIAGYRTSKIRLGCFYFLNILTLGISFLILRWMPRFRINLYGRRENLGNCDWVVVENEHGELDIIDIEKQWFNRNLDIVFNFKKRKHDGDFEDELVDPDASSAMDFDPNAKVPVLLTFSYRYLKLIYNPLEDIYTTNTNWVDKSHWSSTSKIRHGLSEYETEDRKLIFGSNSLDLKESSISELLVKEILHPFYIFQIFSIVLWLLDDYYYYAFCIFFISIVSVVQSLIETRETMRKLKEISKLNNYPYVRIKRNGFWKEVPLEELVPGDLYELSDPNLSSIPCDSVLISGDCIINESMLTGESVPVSKVPVSDETLKKHLVNLDSAFVTKNQVGGSLSKSYLFSGTKIIRVRRSQDADKHDGDDDDVGDNQTINSSMKNEPALAVVIKIGFSTTKGQLLRSMLFPKPVGFKFYRDSFKYIGFMAMVAFFGFLYSIHNFLSLNLETSVIVLRAFDIITIVVPPALPATLTIGTNFAINRLKNSRIFCISPSKVNIAGKVDVFCFDKTGTLTEDGLDILGVHIAQKASERNISEFGPMTRDLNTVLQGYNDMADFSKRYDDTKGSRTKTSMAENSKILHNFLMSLCSCHSLRVVDGECIGDPLDFKMFEFTKWILEEDFEYSNGGDRKNIYPLVSRPSTESVIDGGKIDNYIAIVKNYEFIPSLRRMSVISKTLSENCPGYQVFTKGAPEVISALCNPESLPENYEELLYRYTHDGYRVIAVATKSLSSSMKQINKMSRPEIESNLDFLGFIIFENRLKELTKPTLEVLNCQANIRTIMCTGDNILTAISVAKESSLISDPKTKIFIPRFVDEENEMENDESNKDNGINIMWEDVNDPELILDSQTLSPIVKRDSPLEYFDYKLAVTGDIFRYILKNEESDESPARFSQEYIEKLLLSANIYARMSPDEKHELVEQLQKLDYTVGFCGDGANDCGALKAANIGISLSEAEASVAAPFTSTNFQISCVLNVIKEGRASLVTSFSCFKYMSLYSAIQFISVSVLYKKGSNLGDFQFLWIDLFLILPIAIFMSWSKPYDYIAKKKPSANLVSSKVLIPMIGNIATLMLFQISIWLYVQSKPWYIKPIPAGDDAVQSSDNTVLFFFSNFQYILIAIILTQGPPYRESSIRNIPFVVDILISIGLSCLLMAAGPESWLGDLMQLTYLPFSFKLLIFVFSVINLVVLWFGDKYVFLKLNKLYIRLIYGGQRKSKKYFKRLLKSYEDNFMV